MNHRSPSGLRPLSLVVLLVALALSLAVLSVAPAASARPDAATTTLRFAGNTGSEVVWRALIANFERQHPGIRVTTEFYAPNTYPQAVLTQLQAGNGPDVFNTSPGNGNINSVGPLARGGHLADLSKLPLAKRVPAAWRSLYFLNGKLYAAGLALGPITLTYRPDLFREFGLRPPSTFSGLLALCRNVSARGKTPISLAGQFPALLGIALAGNYVYSADPSWNAKRARGQVSFSNTAGWRTTLQRFIDLKNANCFSPGVAGVGIPQAIGAFAGGVGLMYLGPAGPVGAIRAAVGNPNLPLVTFPLPGDRRSQTRVQTTYDGIAVNARGDHVAAAKTFVSFIAREGQSRLFAKVNGGVSAIDAKAGRFPDYMNAYVKPVFKEKRDLPFENLAWPNPTVYTNFAIGLTGLLTGQMTPAQVLRSMDDAWR